MVLVKVTSIIVTKLLSVGYAGRMERKDEANADSLLVGANKAVGVMYCGYVQLPSPFAPTNSYTCTYIFTGHNPRQTS